MFSCLGGLLEWTTQAPCSLRKAVFDMFIGRQESGLNDRNTVLQYECCDSEENECKPAPV